MIKNLRKFAALERGRRSLLLEAVIFLFLSKALLLVMPLKTVLAISQLPEGIIKTPVQSLLKELKWSLQFADKLSLWKNRCLVKSIAGRWMLRRRKIASTLCLGVKHGENENLNAHAWLKVDDYEIVDSGHGYYELASFKG